MMLLSVGYAYAQVTATGVVVDAATGEPIIGASVLEEGTSNGTITDFDGNFSLSVGKDAMVVISYVGYKTQQLFPNANMKVSLAEDSEVLEEVVVTGYTTQRKADLTGAVSAVSAKDLEKQQENNPMKALQGKVPGMNISADGNPSGTATVRIRGIGTLNDNDPLYIIDGVPTKSGMHELNPNDIESIQVLKDAASASIYGSRAANGVIIITTKKGAEGKLSITLDASVAVQSYVNRMHVLNSEQYGRAMWQAYINDGTSDPNTNVLGYRYNWGYNAQGQPVLNNIMLNKYLDDAGTVPVSNTDWFKETTRPGIIQNYNVSVSNGGKKGSSFFSLGYYKNEGIIKSTDFDRFSARINSDYKILKDYVTIGENFTVNRTSEVSAPGGFINSVLQYHPLLPVYNTNGELAQAPSSSGFPQRENPMSILERNKDNDLGKYIRIGKGEEHMGGRERPSVLSDIVESVTAAIYLDSGMDAAKDFVMRFVLNDVHMASAEVSDDYKSALQELIQHDPSNILSYELIEEKGPDHSKTFTFAALLNGEVVGTGSGSTKKSAEQAAASNALEKLNDERP